MTGEKSIAQKQHSEDGGKKWGAIPMIILMCVWVFVSIVATQFIVGIIMISILGAEQVERPIWTAIYSALSYIVAGVLIIFVPPAVSAQWTYRHKKTGEIVRGSAKAAMPTRNDLGLKGWPTWTDIGLAPVGLVVSLLLAAILEAIFMTFPWFDAEQVQDVGFNIYMNGADRAIAFLTLVVIAPIAEEIIFRGWLYGKVRERLNQVPEWASIVIATLVVSVLFGAVHGQWNVGVTVFCLSVVLCALREVTGTIYAGILTHMLKNGVAFYIIYVGIA